MRTRRSVRNQNILFKALFEPKKDAVAPAVTVYCFNCVSYPRHGRRRGECALGGMIINGSTRNRSCFQSRLEVEK
jgi:hypothetical protein